MGRHDRQRDTQFDEEDWVIDDDTDGQRKLEKRRENKRQREKSRFSPSE